SQPNRSYQNLFVNGRYVVNQTVGAAVTNAYGAYLMKRQYPFFVLFLEVPPEIVDVNVHPTKADVRFADNQVIYGCVYSVISAVLDGNSRALEYLANVPEAPKSVAEVKSQAAEIVQPAPAVRVQEPIKLSEERPVMTYAQAKKELAFDISPIGKSEPRFYESEPVKFEVHAPVNEEPKEDIFAENQRFLAEREEASKRDKVVQEKIDHKNLIYKGELFRTYLIYEVGDCAYFIDQHAAHERLIYNRLKEKWENRQIVSQPMLVPYIVTANVQEYAFLERNFPVLREIGFEIEDFGGTSLKVSAVPADLQGIDLKRFFDDVLSAMELSLINI
ncbi:MAG: DNA mismatch repair endonuclease MutL, partial [Clostridia bacterium]|nr:DNA mismatch repair endonuclease MutL [Clostridia bacterium]